MMIVTNYKIYIFTQWLGECQGFSQEVVPIQEDYKSVITGLWYVFNFPVNSFYKL